MNIQKEIERLSNIESVTIQGTKIYRDPLSGMMRTYATTAALGVDIAYLAKYSISSGKNAYTVVISIDNTQKHGSLLHASISLPEREPTFSELKDLRYEIWPRTVDVMMVFPRDDEYVNLHPYALHLVTIPGKWRMK